LEQAEKRLKVAAAQASSPAEHKAVAREALAIADKAILDSQGEVAKRLVTLALTAARTAKLDEETKQATLLLIELAQPLTDAVKAKARQRLSERGDAGPAAAVPNTDGGSVKSQTPSSKSQTNPKHQIQNS
jgi:hypothetical protein